jgi:hypothetical protein
MADKLLKPRDKSWIKSFYSFIAIDAFLLNKKTEGMRVWAYSRLLMVCPNRQTKH